MLRHLTLLVLPQLRLSQAKARLATSTQDIKIRYSLPRGPPMINTSPPREVIAVQDGATPLSMSGRLRQVMMYIRISVSYTHLRAHETRHDLVCRLLLEKKKKKK